MQPRPFQNGEAQDSREAADERVHGVGAGGQEEAGRPVPEPAQRGAQQNPGKVVAVSEAQPAASLAGESEAPLTAISWHLPSIIIMHFSPLMFGIKI